MKRDKSAISPIVATLMLVLITVAAAVAFYMFETGWQKSATANVGDGTVSSTQLTMTGSTTVTDLMNKMVPAFEQNNSGFKVSYTGTGSGAGLIAIEKGQVDMGMISDDMNSVTTGTTTAYPNLVSTTIAYDGVDIFFAQATLAYHGITIAAGKNINMYTSLAQAIYGSTSVAPTITTWTQFEAAISNQTTNGVTTTADSAHGSDLLNVHYRSDSSGTQDSFCDKALLSHKLLPYATAPAGTSFKGENGNPLMVTDVLADVDGIGFATGGMVSSTPGAVSCSWGGVTATAQHVIDSVDNHGTSQYALWHPLNLVTNGAPVTQCKSFIDWITAPDNNLAICNAAGFTSIYQSV
jgi:phosphate transport system substrate-binding protein